MRDYTYVDGARFSINNLYRSLRFDVDRLDMSWVDGEKPAFTRGLRIVDNDEMNTVRLDGEDAPPRLADNGLAPNEHPSISKLANLKVWFGNVNSPNRFAEDKGLAGGSKYAVIDCCNKKKI